MSWNSIRELVEDLNLEVNPSNETAVKTEVRKQLFLIHPDRNNGQFSSDSTKERFSKLTKALEYLEEQKRESLELVTRNQLSALVQAFNDALTPFREERLEQTRNA